MKKLILSSDNENRQFAFVKGNRPTNAKTVKAKEKSIKEYGQLSPITVVKGEEIFYKEGHLVDLDGTDYMAAPAMMLANKNEVFDFAMFLRGKGCPLATISLWCTGGNSLKPKDLVACVKNKELPKAFVEAGWYERSVKWYEAAQGKFPDAFLTKKYLIIHLIKKFSYAANPVHFSRQMEENLKNLTDEQVKEIMNPKTGEGQTREQATFDLLDEYLG